MNEAAIARKIAKLEEMLQALEARLVVLESSNTGGQTRLDALLTEAE